MKHATKCHNADKYKGLHTPKCGCDICSLKFQIGQLEKICEELRISLKGAKDSANDACGRANAALYVEDYCR